MINAIIKSKKIFVSLLLFLLFMQASFNPSQKSPGFSPWDEWKLFSAREEASAFRPRFFTLYAASEVDLLKQKIISSKTVAVEQFFEELMQIYVKENKLASLEKDSLTGFDEFYNFLETLERNKTFKNSAIIYYYKAKTHFNQMQYLEEKQMWQEFFDNKDKYEGDLNNALTKAKELSEASVAEQLSLRIRFLEWQIKKEDLKASSLILNEFVRLVIEYVKVSNDVIMIKDFADELSKNKQVNYAKKLYEVYASKISAADIAEEELKKQADEFLKEEEIDIAISLYDAYLDKLIHTGKDSGLIKEELLNIADKFSYAAHNGGIEPSYAEKIYIRLEALYGSDSFNEPISYKRAYNLERIKDYKSCFAQYLRLVKKFPNCQYSDRIYFKLGVLSVFIFNKIDDAKGFFLKVTANYKKSAEYLTSIYYLGLLNHWQGDLEKAQRFYKIILSKTRKVKHKPEIVPLAQYRLNEIKQNKEIDYNLRMFLQEMLKNKPESFYVQSKLYAKQQTAQLDEPVKFKASAYFTETGCLQQEFSYLWSGQLGANQNPFNKYDFETTYQDAGAKVVGVVLVGPTGVVSAVMEIVDAEI